MPKMNIKITEKDKIFFQLIGRYGLATNSIAEIIYGSSYYQRRLTMLSMAGYIKRVDKKITLLKKGKETVGVQIRRIGQARKDNRVKRAAQACEIAAYLLNTELQFMPSWEYKKNNGVDSRRRLIGVIYKGNEKYAVYNIGKDPDDKVIKEYLNELNMIIEAQIKRAIVFYETDKAYINFTKAIKSTNLVEELLVPYGQDGIEIARLHLLYNINSSAIKLVYPQARPPKWERADAEVEIDGKKKSIYSIVLEDVAKEAWLMLYYEQAEYRYTDSEDIILICAKGDEARLHDRFPKAEIVPVSISELTQNIKGVVS